MRESAQYYVSLYVSYVCERGLLIYRALSSEVFDGHEPHRFENCYKAGFSDHGWTHWRNKVICLLQEFYYIILIIEENWLRISGFRGRKQKHVLLGDPVRRLHFTY
jgi:hypothetical protein